MPWPPRAFVAADFAALVNVWHDSWHDAHDCLTPPELVALRKHDHFVARLETLSAENLRVAGAIGAPLGLCVTKADTIDQFFVARAARGTGLATALLHDAEARLFATGVTAAHLDCAAGNDRAARFYTREGWTALREYQVPATAVEPPLYIDVTLFGKTLRAPG